MAAAEAASRSLSADAAPATSASMHATSSGADRGHMLQHAVLCGWAATRAAMRVSGRPRSTGERQASTAGTGTALTRRGVMLMLHPQCGGLYLDLAIWTSLYYSGGELEGPWEATKIVVK